MKKFILFFIALLSLNSMWAMQLQPNDRDSLIYEINDKLDQIRNEVQNNAQQQRYKIYPTENIYNVLKLDTATGKIDIIQWNLDRTQEGTYTLNSEDLSFVNRPGTFELYPTKNMWQFILLDKMLGKTWHVQWGLEEENRWIRRIY